MSTLPVVVATGTGHQLGVAHGQRLASHIHGHLQRWKAMLTASQGEDADRLISRFVTAGQFRPAIERHTPWLVDEVDAIAAGADIAVDDAWFLQLMDESWQQASLFRPDHCTAFAVVDGSRSWSGQTMDLEAFRHGAQALLDLHPAGQFRQQIVTMSGSVGLFGVSSAGFSVCVNALSQVPTRPDGLPVLCMIRGALAQPDADEAERFIRHTPHATGQAYTITGTRSVVALECSAVGVVESMPGERRRWHTNHPLVGYVPEPTDAESERRGECVRSGLRPDEFSLTAAEQLLSESPIHRPLPDQPADSASVCTFAAAVFELRDGVDPLTSVCLPGENTQWTSYTLPRVRVIDRQNPATSTPT
jgi:isopenicillin-N N-acyltransferase like protein